MIRESLENKRIQMGIIITLLAIGFAAVATNLFINGTAKIGFSELDVYYSRAVINGEEDNSVITSRRVIEFETPVMTTLGEKYTLEYDVTNGSKNYDAKLQMNCTSDGNEFVSIKNTFNLDDLLKARTTRSGVLVIKLIKPSTEDRTFNIQCQIDAEPIEREEPGGDEIVKEPKTLVETIMSKANDDSINEYDAGDKGEVYAFQHEETAQLKANTDYRFIGDVPNNYIRFNEEDWRVIGVFEDEDGVKRAKIIKDAPMGTFTTSNPPTHVIDSELKDTLDNLYNDDIYYNQIDRVNYYLGVNSGQLSSAEDYYNYERNTQIASGNNKYKLSMKVGLMYASDYFYTYAYGVDDFCATYVNGCGQSPISVPSSSWMYRNEGIWTIDYLASSNMPTVMVNSVGSLYVNTGTNYVYPVVYLDEDIIHSDGDGTKENPYIIESSKKSNSSNKPTTSDNNLVNIVMSKKNDDDADYNRETKKEVFTFEHEATEQLGANTDYRFIGDSPNNYIIFDKELFRIIGIFEDEQGVKRAKIIRDQPVKYTYATSTGWNYEYFEGTSFKALKDANSNNWEKSDLYNQKVKKSISDGGLNYVDTVKYYLGGISSYPQNPLDLYKLERGTEVYDGNSYSWTGKMGLLYASDYFYTYAKGFNDACLTNMSYVSYGCLNNSNAKRSWLAEQNNMSYWFLNTSATSTDVYHLEYNGTLRNYKPTTGADIRDVLYLKNDVVSSKGDGSKENPYVVETHDSVDHLKSDINGSLSKNDIEKITFVDSNKAPDNAISSWDVSVEKNGRIIAYVLDDDKNNMYELYIGKEGKIYTDIYASNLFSFPNVKEIVNIEKVSTKQTVVFNQMFLNAHALKEIDLNSFDMSNAHSVMSMFKASNFESINIENWDTSAIADFSELFMNCSYLKRINLSKWDTSSAIKMHSLFEYCYEIEEINLKGWDTSNVENFGYMFNYCKKLKKLDISTFNTSSVTYMANMFAYCEELESLDLSNFNNQSLLDVTHMFDDCVKLVNLKLSDNFFPIVNNATYLFYNCYKLNTTILLPHGFSQWTGMFVNTSIEEGAKTVLNYKSEAETFVDAMILQKDSSIYSRSPANVVKGELIA